MVGRMTDYFRVEFAVIETLVFPLAHLPPLKRATPKRDMVVSPFMPSQINASVLPVNGAAPDLETAP